MAETQSRKQKKSSILDSREKKTFCARKFPHHKLSIDGKERVDGKQNRFSMKKVLLAAKKIQGTKRLRHVVRMKA